MYPKQSYWEYTSFFKNIDILIVGSGIVGLSAAIRCKEQAPSKKVIIIEKGTLPTGASTRNAGFACFGSMTELLDDLETQSESEVFALVERRWRGLARLRQRIGDAQLGYREWGGFEIFRKEEQTIAEQCLSKIDRFNRLMRSITGLEKTYQLANHQISQMGFAGIDTMLVNTAEGQIHTGDMMKNLLAIAQSLGVEIYNGLGVEAILDKDNSVEIKTDAGWAITTRQVLVATNGFARSLLPNMAVQPARNQVLITEPIPNLSVQGCFHYDRGYFYFRNIDNRILLGGGRHLDQEREATDKFGLTPFIQAALQDLLETVILPQQEVKVAATWSGILGIGNEKKPVIQRVSPNVVVVVRMGGMGVAIGSLVGEEGANLLFAT